MLREGLPIGAIVVARSRRRALPRPADRAAQDLRRPGRHRHRERPAVQGARGADARPDALGGRAPGARRGQPGRQLHARPRDRARDHRQPRRRALRQLRRDRLRVRRGHADLPRAGHAPHHPGAPRSPASCTDPARGGRDRSRRRDPGARPGRRHRGRAAAGRPPGASASGSRQGMRSLLAVPLVREDRLLGGLVIIRRERGAFSPEVVATLQTFAAQSVLAIHNAGPLPGDPAPEAVLGRARGDEPGGDRDHGPRRHGRGLEPRRRAALRVHAGGGPRPPHGRPRGAPGGPRGGPRQHPADARGRVDPRDRAARPEGRHAGGRRDLVHARGRRRRQGGHDRDLSRHHRAPPGPPGGRGGQRGQERLPGHDEPRDPDPDERRDRDERAPPEHRR